MNAQRIVKSAFVLGALSVFALAFVPMEALAFEPTNVRKPNVESTPTTLRHRSIPIAPKEPSGPNMPQFIGPQGALPSPGNQQKTILPPNAPGAQGTVQAHQVALPKGGASAVPGLSKPGDLPGGLPQFKPGAFSDGGPPSGKGSHSPLGMGAKPPAGAQTMQMPKAKGLGEVIAADGVPAATEKGTEGVKSGYSLNLQKDDGGFEETSYEWKVEPTRSKTEEPDPFHTAPSPSPPSNNDDDGDKVE
jgi:hypothetical protein